MLQFLGMRYNNDLQLEAADTYDDIVSDGQDNELADVRHCMWLLTSYRFIIELQEPNILQGMFLCFTDSAWEK